MSNSSRADSSQDGSRYFKSYTRPTQIPFPEGNKYSDHRYELGRKLFFDPRLSGSNKISCATCHQPGLDWEDGLTTSIGESMTPLPRHTPTILNLAWGELFLWDGRAESLEEQALLPIASHDEMNLDLDKMLEKIAAIPDYKDLFDEAYPKQGLSMDTIAKAIATFERTIISSQSPFDRWIAGDSDAISDSAKRGFVIFNGKAMCSACHSTWRFTDDGFHDIGIDSQDRGRGDIIEDVESLEFAFKTPTLRNIAERAPYMHDGSESTLEDVLEFYNRGGDVQRPSLSENIRPLGLSDQDKLDLVNFLKTLTSNDMEVTAPRLPK